MLNALHAASGGWLVAPSEAAVVDVDQTKRLAWQCLPDVRRPEEVDGAQDLAVKNDRRSFAPVVFEVDTGPIQCIFGIWHGLAHAG